jgi:hypothetical protein
VRKESQPSLTFKSQRIAQGRNESSTFELTKRREELAYSLAGGHAQRALTEGNYTHFVISGIARSGRKSQEFRLANS